MFTLTDLTTGQTWACESERQLRTVTTLYATAHPRSGIAVTINGVTHTLR